MVRVARGKALVAKLRAQAGVRDPEALAAYLGRFKKARKAGKSPAEAAKAARGGDSSNGSSKSSTASPSKPKRITKEDVDRAPWKYSAQQYQIGHGVDQPSIGEISPTQFSRMSKRGKMQYEAKRRQEWQASADIKTEWREKVEKAYREGKINKDTPGLSKEARSAIIHSNIRKRKEDEASAVRAAEEGRTIRTIDQVEKGDEVEHTIYGPARVVRKSAKSVRILLFDRDGKPRKNRDGSPSTVNIPVKHFVIGALKRRKKK